MYRLSGFRFLILSFLLIFTFPVSAADEGFQQWVKDFRKTALANGISPEVFDRAFAGIESPDQWVLDKASYQPEFKAPVWQYFDNRVQQRAIRMGRAKKEELQPWLDKIEQRFGVNPNILLAIWSIESSFGAILDNQKVIRSVVRSLATLAYADPKRSKFGRQQLLAALKILESGDVDEKHLVGSWAGAMGHTQFIPTSYQAYAVDIDGDGKRDIWNSVPDALATAASLLSKNGWRSGETWGYEVTIPERKLPAGKLTLREWEKLGVKRVNGKAFPRPDDKAELKLPAGRGGPAFLMLKNFFVLKRYNNSDRYATAVGLLADQIGGGKGLVQDWPRPFTPIDSTEVEELQKLLKERGLYEGEIDGKAGSGTRKGIQQFEKSIGVEVQGFPSKEVLEELRKNR
ncbi:lytic murein transglycosylase [Microbulbifer flavimaris]|uniref:Lytic murein transglycosylase n=1 Tax=Microbulbifer flavimaris TaxID=1781068 RepID=A0ABX4HZB1_9GAMM|nr:MULTISPECIES: lytic murein transglycosylase [Microbulbifer]KUJ82864.1 lytic transglycosylase [Microbulbifer sp. ZGT114]PCO05042.1 lytic murein transglycosylase [Microbulbifer flavimaris]